jgi:hypothetical protein
MLKLQGTRAVSLTIIAPFCSEFTAAPPPVAEKKSLGGPEGDDIVGHASGWLVCSESLARREEVKEKEGEEETRQTRSEPPQTQHPRFSNWHRKTQAFLPPRQEPRGYVSHTFEYPELYALVLRGMCSPSQIHPDQTSTLWPYLFPEVLAELKLIAAEVWRDPMFQVRCDLAKRDKSCCSPVPKILSAAEVEALAAQVLAQEELTAYAA